MKNLIKKLYEIKVDKILHFICGLIIYEIMFAILIHFITPILSLIIAFIASTAIGAAKEWIYDKKYGVPNINDFYATEIGIIIGTIIMLL